MSEPTEKQVDLFSDLLGGGKSLPDDFSSAFAPQGNGSQLIYPGKREALEILATAKPALLVKRKQFGDTTGKEWHNRMIFGDNLTILKRLLDMKEDGELKNEDDSTGVRLIYIDPPFGTGDSYGRKQVNAYSAKLSGYRYLEWLRQRIILLREILSDHGSFYMRTDYHFGHYMKVLLDEVFGQSNFRNEIVINRTKKIFDGISRFNSATDSLLFYTKTGDYLFHGAKKPRVAQKWIPMHSPGVRWTRVDQAYLKFYKPEELRERNGKVCSRGRVFNGKVLMPPEGRHWTFVQRRLERYLANGRIRLNPKSGMLEYLTSPDEIVDSNWTDIPGYTFKWRYPTENSEQLLQRIIEASSNPGDLLLDAFAGSGTMGAVAEKLGRRWIMIDSSKTSVFTITRRMLNLKARIGNTGKALRSAPFAIYSTASGMDKTFDVIPFKSYRRVALSLFRCNDMPHELGGFSFDGYRRGHPVLVFHGKDKNQRFLLPGTVRQLHSLVGHFLQNRMYIIVPAQTVTILEDVVEFNGKEYHILRIPTSILTELHNRSIGSEEESMLHNNVSRLRDSVAFDLMMPPEVRCHCFLKSNESGDLAVIRIDQFATAVRSEESSSVGESGFGSLSLVMIDYNYNGYYFSLGETWEAAELKEAGFQVQFPVEKASGKLMIIYVDVFGNEKKEVKTLADFERPNGEK